MVFPSSFAIRNYFDQDDYVGTVIISLKENAFSNNIKDIYQDKPGNIMILNCDNQIMLSAKPLEQSISPELFDQIEGEKGFFSSEVDGVNTLVTYYQNDRTGWYSVSTIPISFLISDTVKIKNAIIRISLMVLFLCFILSYLITIGITGGFTKLKGVMMKIRSGDFSIRVNSERKDEIGQLSNTFDTMIERINDLIEKGYEQKIRENHAQLKALQAQIAPHFLYNALDSINWLLIDKDEYEISNIVVALGGLLRYSISNNRDMVPVKDEIEQVQNYLMIQKVRFEDRLTYRIKVDQEMNEKLIPKLIIQPIVENSLIHGIEKMGQKGLIEVIGYQTNESSIFEIRDDGIGISPEKLEAVFDNPQDKDASRSHLGLSNVMQRIKLIYGEDYGIVVTSHPGQGTVVKIILPRNFESGGIRR